MTRQTYDELAPSPHDYLHLFRASFKPMVTIYSGLGDEAARRLDHVFLEFVGRWNREEPKTRVRYEYLLVVARKR